MSHIMYQFSFMNLNYKASVFFLPALCAAEPADARIRLLAEEEEVLSQIDSEIKVLNISQMAACFFFFFFLQNEQSHKPNEAANLNFNFNIIKVNLWGSLWPFVIVLFDLHFPKIL